MGDKPSGSIATMALRKTAEMKAKDYPLETGVIINSSYMDDIIDSAKTFEQAKIITKNISKILKEADFHIKDWVISSDKHIPVDFELFHFLDGVERVLGMSWVPYGDYFRYAVKLNFSKKKNKIRTEPDLSSADEIENKIPVNLTKRMILSQLNGIYDPLGLVSPFVIKGKILLRKLWVDSENSDWDHPVSEKMRQEWVRFFEEMFQLPELLFERCVKPNDSIGDPILIIFSDASREAYGACCYVRWELDNGTFQSKLLISISKIAPVKVITIVRLELLAAIISARLRKTLEKECRYNFKRVIHIIDSNIVRAMIQRESYGFNTFASTKIGERKFEPDRLVLGEW